MLRIVQLFSLLLFAGMSSFGQFRIGTWRDHLPYFHCVDVCVKGEKIYAATPYSVFSYNPADEEIFRISKANFLSDVGITAMEYDAASGYVVVGYDNGNIDFITEKEGRNLPDIKFSSIVGDKAIYDILPYDNKLYLSTGFGVVVVDPQRMEVKETYFIGENGGPVRVNDIDIYQGKIYAATETGLQTAELSNPFLANFLNWNLIGNLPGNSPAHQVVFFHDEMVLAIGNEVGDTLWRKALDGNTWIAQSGFSNSKLNKLWSQGDWLTVSWSFGFQTIHNNFNNVATTSSAAGYGLRVFETIADQNGKIWAADKNHGLISQPTPDGSQDNVVIPEGPLVVECRRLGAYNDNVWLAHGGVKQDWSNSYRNAGVSGLVGNSWELIKADTANFSGCNITNDNIADFMDVAIDPLDNNRVFFCSWEEGLLEIDVIAKRGYVRNGDSEHGPVGSGFTWFPGWTGVAGVVFDRQGILWCNNSYSTQALHALDRSGNFYDFDCAPIIGPTDKISDIIVGNNGLVWTNVISKGLLVLNTNGTLADYSDDAFKLLTETEGNGKLPSIDVQCMEEDLDGEVWVGTAQGLAIFYNPDALFSEDSFDAEQILIEQDGNVQVLLETESITAIEIDGSNRKWIGTRNSGVYLFSDDGLQQIYHFTEENSPLFSNNIFDIAINHSNGEVFFATETGVLGFYSTATNFDEEMSNVRIYPNPIRPDFSGDIVIDGLAYDANVKITDIAGSVIYETSSEGGRAIWNGLRFDGSRPASGVYMVFVATSDGSAEAVKKITFIR